MNGETFFDHVIILLSRILLVLSHRVSKRVSDEQRYEKVFRAAIVTRHIFFGLVTILQQLHSRERR